MTTHQQNWTNSPSLNSPTRVRTQLLLNSVYMNSGL